MATHLYKNKPLKKKIQFTLYQNKWVLLVFYFGLFIGLIFYGIKFCFEEYYILRHFLSMSLNDYMIGMLTLIDIAMVAALVKMVTTGGYQSFIDKVPENTEKVSSGVLKVKMSTSLVGVTAIHLLKDFMIEGFRTPEQIQQLVIKMIIHVIFIYSSIKLGEVDLMHSKSELIEEKTKKIELQNEMLLLEIKKHHADNKHHGPIKSRVPIKSTPEA